MTMTKLTGTQMREALEAVQRYGGVNAAARATGLHKETLRHRYRRALAGVQSPQSEPPSVQEPEPLPPRMLGEIQSPETKYPRLPGDRFVLTCAQNNTLLHEGFWAALQGFCKVRGARLIVSRCTYNAAGWQAHGGVTRGGVDAPEFSKEVVWDPRVLPYVLDENVYLADDLMWCGETDQNPTAVNPLASFESYTRSASGIIPHTKVAHKSVATMKFSPPKMLYTTGAVTQRNYIPRKTGQIATFHHVFGALYVEVSEDGAWFVRHLIADDAGAFIDLGELFTPQRVKTKRIARPHFRLGDIHAEQRDEAALNVVKQAMRDLQPFRVTLDDVLDMRSRNHHNLYDPHFLAQMAREGRTVRGDVVETLQTVDGIANVVSDAIVDLVLSNHDKALLRWLKNPSGAADGPNARFWHQCNAAVLGALESGGRFNPFELVMRQVAAEEGLDLTRWNFLNQDDSLVVYDIENGLHGDLGANGARGSLKAFDGSGHKTTSAHKHGSEIHNGAWCAPTLSKLDLIYNVGLSNWSQGFIIAWPNTKRQLITLSHGRYRG